jgi:hypothetical protein
LLSAQHSKHNVLGKRKYNIRSVCGLRSRKECAREWYYLYSIVSQNSEDGNDSNQKQTWFESNCKRKSGGARRVRHVERAGLYVKTSIHATGKTENSKQNVGAAE